MVKNKGLKSFLLTLNCAIGKNHPRRTQIVFKKIMYEAIGSFMNLDLYYLDFPFAERKYILYVMYILYNIYKWKLENIIFREQKLFLDIKIQII